MTASEVLALSPALERRLERLTLVSRRRLARDGQGERRSALRGSSLQFVDFRAYAPGDDLRQIDWSVYGRTDELFVRLYEAEQILTVHLLIDVSRSMEWGTPSKRRKALEIAGALSCVALGGYDRLQIGFLADRTVGLAGPFWGRPQRAAALAALANAPSARVTDFAAAIGSYLDRVQQPGLLILLSDLLSSTAEAGLRRLATARHEAVVIHLLAPDDLVPEPAEDVELVDCETGQVVDVSLDLATIARYRQRLAEWLDHLDRLCRERGARYLRLRSDDDLERTILGVMRTQGVLA
ncbi:MAG: DUF58 domain-containing protein [Chloroflexi bacterium]|nr:DUF58 domain-containing protein [Chloroflexota bacterium]